MFETFFIFSLKIFVIIRFFGDFGSREKTENLNRNFTLKRASELPKLLTTLEVSVHIRAQQPEKRIFMKLVNKIKKKVSNKRENFEPET